jgi:hypothetical protein
MLSGLKGIANYASFTCVIVILAVWIIGQSGRIKYNRQLICVFMFLLFYAMTSFVNMHVDFFITEFSYYVISFSPVVIALLIEQREDKNAALCLVKITLFFWLLMCLRSISMYIANPNLARIAAADQSIVSGMIFGGYQFTFASALLCVYLFSVAKKNYEMISNRMRFALYVFCVLLFVEIYLTQSTVSTLGTIVGIITVLFLETKTENKKNRVVRILIFCVLAIVCFVTFTISLEAIYIWLVQHSENLLFYRLKEVVDAFVYDSPSRHYAKRTDTITESLSTFINNPILGVGYKYGNVTSIGRSIYGVGNHSEFFDAMAQFGIIGGVPFLLTYYLPIKKYCMKNIGVVITLVILIVCNPFCYFLTNLIMMLFIPISSKLLADEKAIYR